MYQFTSFAFTIKLFSPGKHAQKPKLTALYCLTFSLWPRVIHGILTGLVPQSKEYSA